MRWLPPTPRIGLYVALNAAFVAAVLMLASIGGAANSRILYLILLFAVCSAPIIDLDGLNGRFIMPSLYLGFYFVSFGLLDFINLAKGISSETVSSIFSATEGVVLAGSIMMTIGYRVAMAPGKRTPKASPTRDWPINTILSIGVFWWTIGTAGTYILDVYIVTDNSIEASKKGFEIMG